MKKSYVLISVFLFSLFFTSVCNGNFNVKPAEISITMTNEFIYGNTFKKITVTNNNNYSINMTWYVENPNPVSWMRPNKTYMPNLSWVDLNPRWCIISPWKYANFYIYLFMPGSKDYLNQHWETWVTFKHGKDSEIGTFNQEYAVRVYIDTPKTLVIDNNNHDLFSIKIGDQMQIPVLYVIIAAAIATTITVFYVLIYRKKKS